MLVLTPYSGSKPRKMSHAEAGALAARAWDVFVNVDGNAGRTVCPLPHAPFNNARTTKADVEAIDQLSAVDRLEQIGHLLTNEERGVLEALLLHISGGTLETTATWDLVHSNALQGHSSVNFEEVWTTYKLREGQSGLARAMFDEACISGLDYAFKTPVDTIRDLGNFVEIHTATGSTFRATRVISTIPLNVLHTIKFEPPVSPTRAEAFRLGHINHMSKIHAEVKGDIASWCGLTYPAKLMFGYSDGLYPNGNTHIVTFGADETDDFVPEKNPEQVIEAMNKIRPMDVQRLVSAMSSSFISVYLANKSFRSSITGIPTHGPWLALRGIGLGMLPSIRKSFNHAMEISSLRLPTGQGAGELR